MTAPKFTITKDARTPGGSMWVRELDTVAGTLSHLGYVLLPSDTAYALAALAMDSEMQLRINKILSRPDMPTSLAFPSALAARKWVSENLVVDYLLEHYCPGPITVVCRARDALPAAFFDKTIASRDRTIGVRIPDSIVERDVAGCTNFPVTTVAIRDPRSGAAVTSFRKAAEIVAAGMNCMPGAQWCAIEGQIIYSEHSTVVRVTENGDLSLLRPGYIAFDDIERSVEQLPAIAFRKWS